jgi:hypothetical protein
MPLEAVMIVVDNSESSRNGDYPPTRFDAQADAVNILFQNVIQGNPESSVGLMSMGGKGPEVLVTLTTDQGKIYEGLHRTKKTIRGHAHLATGIQVAGVRFLSLPDNNIMHVANEFPGCSWPSNTDKTSPSGNGSSSSCAHRSRRKRATWSSWPRR